MYKKQMKLQRIICILALAACVVMFLYSLGLMTDLYSMLYKTIPDPEDPSSAKVQGAFIYYDMQSFNSMLLKVSIGMILLSCALFITNTHSRRRYYIGNYISTGLYLGGARLFRMETAAYVADTARELLHKKK